MDKNIKSDFFLIAIFRTYDESHKNFDIFCNETKKISIRGSFYFSPVIIKNIIVPKTE